MADKKPLVSIGIPVFNGERFIRESLDSLLAQDYANLEIIISDNASTDGTGDVCREYLHKEARICYYRNEINLGAVANFNRVLELSSGKYFMWASDHDLWEPGFVSRCVYVLETEADVVLVYSRTMLIDLEGIPLGLTPDQMDTRGMPPGRRFRHLLLNLTWCNMIYGVISLDVLRQTRRCTNVWGSDTALLADLSLRGSFAQLPEVLFYRRKNRPDEEPQTYKNRMLYAMDPMTAGERTKTPIEDLYHETHLILCNRQGGHKA